MSSLYSNLYKNDVDKSLLLCPAFDLNQRWKDALGLDSIEKWKVNGHHKF